MFALLGALALLGQSSSAQSSGSAAGVPAAPQPRSGAFVLPPVTCPPGAAEEAQLLALPFQQFDQGTKGWRLYALNGCHRDAARLISIYAEKIEEPRKLAALQWHRFQMLAFADDVRGALDAMREVKRLDEQRNADAGWRIYVAGTQAFLEDRRKDLERHIAELSAFADQHGTSQTTARLNGNVLQGLLRCFGKPYKFAYLAPCFDLEAARAINRERRPPPDHP
jgi:hypothetical protein